MFNTAATQIIGFLRTALIASLFGASLEIDSYYISLIVPSFVSAAVISWLQVVFVGQYSSLRSRSVEKDVVSYRTSMLAYVSIVALAMLAICVTFPQQIMGMLLPAGQNRSLAAHALVLSSLTIVPIIISDFCGLILNCHGKFFAPSVAPAINAAISVIALWLWPTIDLNALLFTLILGSLGQFLIVVWALLKLNIRFELGLTRSRGMAWKTILVGLPILPSILLSNATGATVQLRSAHLGEGAVAILSYAQRLSGALGQVLVIGLGTILLPHIASLMSSENKAEVLALIRKVSRVTVVVSTYFLVGIDLFGFPAVKAILARGSFDAGLAKHVSEIWLVLTLSLFPYALGTFIAKVAQAMGRSVLLLTSSAMLFAVVWIVTLWGAIEQNLAIIAASFAAAFFVTSAFWLAWMAKSFNGAVILRDLLKAAAYAAPALAAGSLCDAAIAPVTSSWPALIEVAVRGSIYTIVGVAILEACGFRRWVNRV